MNKTGITAILGSEKMWWELKDHCLGLKQIFMCKIETNEIYYS